MALPLSSRPAYPERSAESIRPRYGSEAEEAVEAAEEAEEAAGRRKLQKAARTQAIWRKLRRVIAEVSRNQRSATYSSSAQLTLLSTKLELRFAR